MNTQVIQSILTIREAQANPLRQWEDSDFGQKVLRAEQTLDSVNLWDAKDQLKIPIDLIEKLKDREAILMTDCDSISIGSGASKERSCEVSQRVDEINATLTTLADKIELSKETKDLLGIQ